MAFDFASFGKDTGTKDKKPGFDFNSFGAATPAVAPPPQQANSLDAQLSDMPGVLGAVGSGVYNAAKGLYSLGSSAAYDAFQAINHPITSGKAVADFLGGELTGGAKNVDALGSFVQSTVGSKGLLGVAQLPGRVIDKVLNPNDTSGVNDITAANALGTTINAALTALTFGEGNLGVQAVKSSAQKGLITPTVEKTLTSALDSWGSRAIQSGGIMTGFQAGSNLQENRPVTEGLKQAFFAGAALPTVVQKTGELINKVTPASLTGESGSLSLKKAIGFRGNAKEKVQYDKAAPVVYDTLKSNGFKITDATDPNNLINLDKGVQAEMTKILAERTKRIQSAGGDATVSGDLAAKAIRNLVEPGSVEDLTNPALRERLDAVAQNFEGKKYTPVEAQRAIEQANNGFSFSDNPAVGSKIKMAISGAFTPELDRIVRGAEAVTYDAKGKPVTISGGTAELNKKWSAFKAFKTQLDKKLILEERKATYSLPDRLTGPEIAGKVGEAIGNPMIIPQKLGGAALEYLANKILGDRNSVNYRVYQAFNKAPIGEILVNMLNKFTKAKDIVRLLEQNPLIQNVFAKIYAQELSTVDQAIAKGPESSSTPKPPTEKLAPQVPTKPSSPMRTTK